MRRLFLCVCGLMGAIVSNLAALGQIRFPTDSNLCQDAQWKLVWYDEFSGDKIDTSKWYTFSDDENWHETGPGTAEVYPYAYGRLSRLSQGKVIYRDENIIVGDGTCRLRSKYEPNTWSGPSWNELRYFTSGMLLSKNSFYRHTLYFNKGRFDFRAKLPYQTGAWSTFWLYGGGQAPNPNANPPFEGQDGCEIDIVEYNPCIGGGSQVTKMDDLPWNMHGQNRGPKHTENHDIGGQKNVSNLGDWHLYSTEWDDNYINLYVDGYLRHTQARYTIGRNPVPTSAPCITKSEYDYYDDKMEVFPRPDEGMKLVLTNDITDNIYSENVLGYCTPIPDWVKSHDAIDAEWRDADFEVDYVRIYQRADKIQAGFGDLCPQLHGETAVCQPSTQTYTYTLRGSYTNPRWKINSQYASIISSTDSSITLRFLEGNYSTSLSVAYINGVAGCEQIASAMNIMVGPPLTPKVSADISHLTGQRFQNKLKVDNAFEHGSYTWSIASTNSIGAPLEMRTGSSIVYVSSYTPILYSVDAGNACGATHYSNASELGRFDGGISKNADYVFPVPARETVILNFSDDYFRDSRTLQVHVIDCYGKVVISTHSSDGIVQVPLNVARLLPGVYSIELAGQKKRGYLKLVKL